MAKGLIKKIFSFGKTENAKEDKTLHDQTKEEVAQSSNSTQEQNVEHLEPSAQIAAAPEQSEPSQQTKQQAEQNSFKNTTENSSTTQQAKTASLQNDAQNTPNNEAESNAAISYEADFAENSPSQNKEPAKEISANTSTPADEEAELTPFEAWQAEQKAKAEKKEKRKADRAKVSAYGAQKPREIDQAGLIIHKEGEEAQTEEEVSEPHQSWLVRLKKGMSQSSHRLNQSLGSVFTKTKLDEESLEDLEDILLQSDLGLETTLNITDRLRETRYGKDVSSQEVSTIMADEISQILQPCAKALELDLSHKPHVILVVGVNGTGKTTTIGKLAAKLNAGGLSVMMAAGDTFRAAAIEQLHIWGKRTNSHVVSSKIGGDAASLAYDAYKQAKEAQSDVLLIDTAGRLQNKTELMDELAKIVRVLKKLDPDAPHTVLQNLDATTGQNALAQVDIFQKTANVSGLVMTKLDGTARGGILVAIAAKYKLPIYFIGVGEGIADLEPFSADDFAHAIIGE